MDTLTRIWVYLAGQPLLWLTVTVGAYGLAQWLFRATRELPLANPVLLAVAALVSVLLATDTDYQTYFDGAQFVHFLLGPATVALAIPLYGQAERLRRLWLPIGVALLAGSLTAITSTLGIGYLMGLDTETLRSLVPKSVTTPIAMGIAEQIGGLPSLTAVLVILTGITGAVLGIPMLRLVGFRDPVAKGFAVGVAAHGIGTARAFSHSEAAGAFSGLAMGLNGAVTAILVPVLLWLTGG